MSVNLIKKWVTSNSLVLIIITIYFLLSIIKIEHPGVNNDQLMFVNTATLNADNPFLWKSYRGIPMMVFPYIGALKSYLYMPVFYLFDVNIWSIRLPQIILIAVTWFLFYKALKLQFNNKLALLALVFLSIDPSLIAYSKVDVGPTVLEFFFKVLSIYLCFLYLSTKNKLLYFCIFPVLALGIFNKINFFWFVNAFLFSFIIFYGKSFYNDFKSYGKFVPPVLIIIPYYLLLRFFMKLSRETALSYKVFANEVSISNILATFPILYKNLTEIINGNLFFNMVYGYNPTEAGTFISNLTILILLVGIAFIVFKRRFDLGSAKAYYFLVLIVGLLFLQMLLTKRAVSAWHALVIYPLFTVILVASILQIEIIIKSRLFKNFFTLLIITIVFYQLIVNYLYISKYSEPTKAIAYSSVIYTLIDFAKDSQVKFICLDVDICNQLLSFTQQSSKYEEPFFYLDPPTYNYSFSKLTGNFTTPDKFLYVSHGESNSHFPELRQSFFRYLKDIKADLVKVKEFKDGETVAFEVYKVGPLINE